MKAETIDDLIYDLNYILEKLYVYKKLDEHKKFIDGYNKFYEKYFKVIFYTVICGVLSSFIITTVLAFFTYETESVFIKLGILFICLSCSFLIFRQHYLERNQIFNTYFPIVKKEFDCEHMEARSKFFDSANRTIGKEYVTTDAISSFLYFIEKGLCSNLNEAKYRYDKEHKRI